MTNRTSGLKRAFDVLGALHRIGRPTAVGDLARFLGAPRSTIYALVGELTEAGLLESVANGQVFFGKSIYFYGMDYLRGHDLLARARAEVDRLARETGETAQLCVMHERKYSVAYMSAGARPFRISSDIGTQIPLPWTASGRLLLSDMDEDAIRRLVAPGDLQPPHGASLTTDGFLADVRKARQQGYCVTSGLVDAFTHCIAAPLRDQRGKVVATLCFVVPFDTDAERIASLRDRVLGSVRALSLSSPDADGE